jgi:hypothetical protein
LRFIKRMGKRDGHISAVNEKMHRPRMRSKSYSEIRSLAKSRTDW